MNRETSLASDVLVLGAGMAGLAAARLVAEAGLRVTVLEASDRVGGRIRTERTPDGPAIELGAEFIHGRPPELWALIAEAGLETFELTGRFLERRQGQLVDADRDEDGEDSALERLKQDAGPDRSFREYVGQLGLSAEQLAREIGYVEGFNAADASRASALALGRQQAAEDAIEGERLWKIRGGYDQLPAFLAGKVRAAGGEIVFGAQVDEVRWSAGAVVALCGDGRSFRAARAIVAVPLGVLKAERLRFDPYPSALSAALPGLEMGPVCRLTFVFKRRLWPDGMSFLLTGDAPPAVWWTSHPEDELTLTGWTGGPRAEALLQLAPVALEAHAVGAAAEAFALTEDELRREMVSFHSFDWSADDLTRGAYSWVCVGGLEASERMSRPVEDTLFFAGEHTDTTGLWGTVHAALGSGTRAATDLLRAARIG